MVIYNFFFFSKVRLINPIFTTTFGISIKEAMAEKKITPFSELPSPKEYEHLSQKDRMIAGYPHRPGDSQLCEDRLNARNKLYRYNNTLPEERSIRASILKELFHPDSKDKKVFCIPPFRCDYGYNIIVGNNVEMNYDCVILDSTTVTIGENCLTGPGVHIYTATHPLDPKYRQNNDEYREFAIPVKIGRNVWIGGKAVICPGVTIGDNAVIGAGSVVVKNVPANVVVAGNPAKIVRYLEGADLS